ncbi:MAG: glycoside hydrolase family 9 protein [Myxococcota bacterium]|nr:glycoside hydrolase family 9 protein [Myxococcota bacterium]
MRSRDALLLGCAVWAATACRCGRERTEPSATDGPPPEIAVDQFGYRPEASKVAIVVERAEGVLEPRELELRRVSDAAVGFRGKTAPWRNGAVDPESGDRGQWFDFTAFTEPGEYVVVDPERGTRSPSFRIDRDVYREVLRAATRMFYFNRANQEKRPPYSCVGKRCWNQAASYLGPGQDREARSVRARNDPKTARDLSGGWWDAGDVNKYVTFARVPVNQLLTAYRERPSAFGDDFGIPESGNGVPDLLDEVEVELEWLARMQPDDLGGGVLPKLGNVEYGEPVPERSRVGRFYYPEPCSSASIAAAGVFAHAAWVFRDVALLAGKAPALVERARRAYAHFFSHPRRTDCDDGSITGGDSDNSLEQQERAATLAAVYLFATTADAQFQARIRDHFRGLRPFQDDRWSVYDADEGDALLAYTTLEQADPELRREILERKAAQRQVADVVGSPRELDLYRGHVRADSYHWGSNLPRANYGNTNYDFVQYQLVADEPAGELIDRAEGIVHYLHGSNPLGLVYLSQMRDYGAERSVTQIFHAWFRDGDARWDNASSSELGPAPGYLVGGPNPQYCGGPESEGAACRAAPLRKAAPAKAYRDFNTGYAPKRDYDRSWELSEPSVSYQAAYVKLLSKFASGR